MRINKWIIGSVLALSATAFAVRTHAQAPPGPKPDTTAFPVTPPLVLSESPPQLWNFPAKCSSIEVADHASQRLYNGRIPSNLALCQDYSINDRWETLAMLAEMTGAVLTEAQKRSNNDSLELVALVRTVPANKGNLANVQKYLNPSEFGKSPGRPMKLLLWTTGYGMFIPALELKAHMRDAKVAYISDTTLVIRITMSPAARDALQAIKTDFDQKLAEHKKEVEDQAREKAEAAAKQEAKRLKKLADEARRRGGENKDL